MKFFTLIFALLLTNQAVAHPGHGFDDNLMHFVFHALFWALLGSLVFKVIGYFKNKRKIKKQS